MPSLKLTYFMPGGRIAIPVICLETAGIPYEIETVSWADWEAAKGDRSRFPLGDIPVLTIDGKHVMCESHVINQYIGKLTNMWPNDPLEHALVAEATATAMLSAEGAIPADWPAPSETVKLCEEEKKKAREGPCRERIRFYFGRLDQMIGENPSKSGWVVGTKPTVADLTIAGIWNWISHFDFITAEFLTGFTHVQGVLEKLKSEPSLQKGLKAVGWAQ